MPVGDGAADLLEDGRGVEGGGDAAGLVAGGLVAQVRQLRRDLRVRFAAVFGGEAAECGDDVHHSLFGGVSGGQGGEGAGEIGVQCGRGAHQPIPEPRRPFAGQRDLVTDAFLGPLGGVFAGLPVGDLVEDGGGVLHGEGVGKFRLGGGATGLQVFQGGDPVDQRSVGTLTGQGVDRADQVGELLDAVVRFGGGQVVRFDLGGVRCAGGFDLEVEVGLECGHEFAEVRVVIRRVGSGWLLGGSGWAGHVFMIQAFERRIKGFPQVRVSFLAGINFAGGDVRGRFGAGGTEANTFIPAGEVDPGSRGPAS